MRNLICLSFNFTPHKFPSTTEYTRRKKKWCWFGKSTQKHVHVHFNTSSLQRAPQISKKPSNQLAVCMLFFCYIESWSCHYFRVTYNEARGIWCFVFYAAKILPHPAASGTHGCVCVFGSPVTQSASYLVMLSSLRVLLMRAPKTGGERIRWQRRKRERK